MQEDKEPLFDTVDTLEAIFRVLPPMLGSLTLPADRMREAAGGDFSTATDLADYLVRRAAAVPRGARGGGQGGAPRDRARVRAGRPARGAAALLAADRRDVYPALTVEASLRARAVVGGTAPEAVRRQLAHVRSWLGPGA